MSSLWLSNQEKGARLKHSFVFFLAFIFFSIFLLFLNLPSLKKENSFPLSSVFNALSAQETLNQAIRYLCIALLIFCTFYFVYGSVGELLSLLIPPRLQWKSRKYHWIFTLLTFAPLCCALFISIVSGKAGEKSSLAGATHYLFFQLYFLLGNRVCWKFFSKFLMPEIESTLKSQLGAIDGKDLQKIGSKLTKQHYLGWSSFFLLALFLPFWVLILVLAISFFNNLSAFIFGRKLGSTRLSEYSSTKTMEGSFVSFLVSSLLFSVIAITVYKNNWLGKGNFNSNELGFTFFVVAIVLCASFFSLWGDHRFSLCKRILGYKNYGRIFGFKVGGFWDRFDSLAPALFSVSLILWSTLAIIGKGIGIPNGR